MSAQFYRMLNEGEEIREGDESFSFGYWIKCMASVGETASHSPIRRPIPNPDELLAALEGITNAILIQIPFHDARMQSVVTKSRELIAKAKGSQ